MQGLTSSGCRGTTLAVYPYRPLTRQGISALNIETFPSLETSTACTVSQEPVLPGYSYPKNSSAIA